MVYVTSLFIDWKLHLGFFLSWTLYTFFVVNGNSSCVEQIARSRIMLEPVSHQPRVVHR